MALLGIKTRFDNLVSRALSYCYRRYYSNRRRNRPLEIVQELAAQQSAEFIMENLTDAVLFESHDQLLKWAIMQMPTTGLVMEAGVFEGRTINLFAKWLCNRGDSRLVHGFDSFEGLEEDWSGENLPAGFFDRKGALPAVHKNVRLYKGWVQDTIGPFLAQHNGESIALLHIDTDTYSPARCLLNELKSQFVQGTIVIFDELIGYPNWQHHEHRALVETLSRDRYDFIAFASRQAVIRIKE